MHYCIHDNFLKITKSRRVSRISYFSGSEIALNGREKNLKISKKSSQWSTSRKKSPWSNYRERKSLFLWSYLEVRLTGEYPICKFRVNKVNKTTCASSDCICLSLPKAACFDQKAEPCWIFSVDLLSKVFKGRPLKLEKRVSDNRKL